jgi:hypothetical protein
VIGIHPSSPTSDCFGTTGLAAVLADDLDLRLGAEAEDHVRADLQQPRDDLAVRHLRLDPGGHLHGLLAAHLLLVPVEHPAVAGPLVAHGVDDDHRVAGLVGGLDRLGVPLGPERGARSACVEVEVVGVVLRAAVLGVDDANRLPPARPFASPSRQVLPEPVPPARPISSGTFSRTAGGR